MRAGQAGARDGEWPLLVAGRNISIFCHGMQTGRPREFLTLQAGEQENYR